MALIQWQNRTSMFPEVDRLRQDMDRLLETYNAESASPFSRVYPALNLTEEGEKFHVRAELPGVQLNTLDISVVENRLVIRGERKIDLENKETSYHRRERESGFFRRTIALPARVEASQVTADYKNGALKVTLPKVEEAKPRKISIKAS